MSTAGRSLAFGTGALLLLDTLLLGVIVVPRKTLRKLQDFARVHKAPHEGISAPDVADSE